MANLSLIFIINCFVVMAVFWIYTAPKAKVNKKSFGGWGMRLIAIVVIFAVLLIQKYGGQIFPALNLRFWPNIPVTYLLADLAAFSGLIVMIWARVTLGRNWSANIVLKEDHKLITSGPYAYVRHPIYSGLLLLVSSFLIYYANFASIAILIAFFLGAYCGKGRREEKILSEYFPEYAEYRKRVKALIPFVF